MFRCITSNNPLLIKSGLWFNHHQKFHWVQECRKRDNNLRPYPQRGRKYHQGKGVLHPSASYSCGVISANCRSTCSRIVLPVKALFAISAISDLIRAISSFRVFIVFSHLLSIIYHTFFSLSSFCLDVLHLNS